MHPASIGPYKVERELGRGGMGEVFLAHDARLDRYVAIKALPPHMLQDADRLARFEREAKILASLNHSGISAIHGLEETNGTRYLILEYVEGTTLADAIGAKGLPPPDALAFARQIADALEAAHDRGVVHRDLKPGNVMVRSDGTIKVLDFGLARASEESPAAKPVSIRPDSPTVPSPVVPLSPTIPGAIMGTAGYMSPEQARGRPADKRSDVFSFGCVLYEMLAGTTPFAGETVADAIGSVLHRTPDWNRLPDTTPKRIRELLEDCLAKDPRARWRDMGDVRLTLERAIRELDSEHVTRPARRRLSAAALVAVALTSIAAGFYLNGVLRRQAPTTPISFEVAVPAPFEMFDTDFGNASLTVNRSGNMIALAGRAEGRSRIIVHDLTTGQYRELEGTDGARAPFFSPDGRWIGYFSRGTIYKVPISGGSPLAIAEALNSQGTWTDDGTILFGGDQQIMRVSEHGGTPEVLAKAGLKVLATDGKTRVLGFNRMSSVPGARYALASIWTGDTNQDYAITRISLDDGSVTPIVERGVDGHFVAPGTLVYARESTLYAVKFDPARGAASGPSEPVQLGVRNNAWADTCQFSASPTGTLAFIPGERTGPGRQIIRYKPGQPPVVVSAQPDAFIGGMRLSPDGRNLLVMTLRRKLELWSMSIDRGQLTLFNNQGEAWSPTWSADGTQALFLHRLPGSPPAVAVIPSDGSSPAKRVHELPENVFYPNTAFPDGHRFIGTLETNDVTKRSDLAVFTMNGADTSIVPLVSSPASETDAILSPDGAYFVYVSNESGRDEVYVKASSGTGPATRVSVDGATSPEWARDQSCIYFIDRKGVMHSAPFSASPALSVGKPTAVFDVAEMASLNVFGRFDVMPGGEFLLVQPADWERKPRGIHVVINWKPSPISH